MIEMIKEILMMLGTCVAGVIVYETFYIIISKFNTWRKNGCKIKCLCKPHKYKLVCYWRCTEEAVLECKKCGKRKQVFIDYDSINEKFH